MGKQPRTVTKPPAKKKRKKARRKKKGTKTDAFGRKVPIETPALSTSLAHQTQILRHTAATDYIADPDGHSARWHYERPDRFYQTVVVWHTFQSWVVQDHWASRRTEFWEEVENRVRVHMGDANFRFRVEYVDKLQAMSNVFEELVLPLRDKKGEVERDDEDRPKFAAELPKLDKLAKVFLDITERILELRGEAVHRTETAEGSVSAHTLPPNIRPKLSQEDVRAMARVILRERVPELAEAEVVDGEDVPVGDNLLHEDSAKGRDAALSSGSDPSRG